MAGGGLSSKGFWEKAQKPAAFSEPIRLQSEEGQSQTSRQLETDTVEGTGKEECDRISANHGKLGKDEETAKGPARRMQRRKR